MKQEQLLPPIGHKIWALALPNILSNVTVPLLMLCDMAMAGRMARAESIAAVAIGAAVTHFVIGLWSLLRMGTTGFTAQAWGQETCAPFSASSPRGLLLPSGWGYYSSSFVRSI